MICPDDKDTDKAEFLNKELAFYIDSFCAKAIAKYIKFDTKKSLYEFPKEVIVTVSINEFVSQCFVSSKHGSFYQVDWRYSCQDLFSLYLHKDLIHDGVQCYEQIQLLKKTVLEKYFDNDSSMNSADNSYKDSEQIFDSEEQKILQNILI